MKVTSCLLPCLLALALTSTPAATSHAGPAAAKTATDSLIPAPDRKPAPDFTLTDDHGKPLTLSAQRGKVVLLDFWATWCHGCKTEIPWYVDFDHHYRQRGLTVIGVSMDDEGMKVVKPFLPTYDIHYPVVIGNQTLGHKFGLGAMPLTLLIDRSGRIALAHAGVVDKDDFERQIQQLLRQS